MHSMFPDILVLVSALMYDILLSSVGWDAIPAIINRI